MCWEPTALYLCWRPVIHSGVNLARGYPRYSPDEFSAADVLERHETDVVVLIGSTGLGRFPSAARDYLTRIPTILLEHPFGEITFEPTVRITTAVYGIHRGTEPPIGMDKVPIPLRLFARFNSSQRW